MKITTWNINGLKSSIKNKSLLEYINDYKPDILCVQEIKISSERDIDIIKEELNNGGYKYTLHWNRKGYSGVGMIYKKNIKIIKKRKNNNEGRLLFFELEDFILINVYVPNSGSKLEKLSYRVNEWDKELTKFVKNLTKPIILCGDMNVANEEIDIAKPNNNRRNAGFTNEERESFKEMLKETDLKDVWRTLNPEKKEYTFWSYFHESRKKNIGWRLDYFLTKNINYVDCKIITNQLGSDHCPVELII